MSEPDAADPLGGVLRVRAEIIDRIDIVNFCNPPIGGRPALAEMALRDALPSEPGSPLRVVTLPHLVLFKLYAGGPKSKNDVLELLSRNPELGLERPEELLAARSTWTGGSDAWLRELKGTAGEMIAARRSRSRRCGSPASEPRPALHPPGARLQATPG